LAFIFPPRTYSEGANANALLFTENETHTERLSARLTEYHS